MKTKFDSELVTDPQPELKVVTETDTAESLPQHRFQLVTLGDLGASLPVGVGPDRVRTFRLRPFNMGLEKELAQAKEKMKVKSGGLFVRTALGLMCQTVGPHNFDKMKQPERELVINSMYMPDVIYLYLYARHVALENEPVTMQIRCMNCAKEYNWYGDLSSMDVKVMDPSMPLTRAFELVSPITPRSKTVSKLTLGLIKWESFCKPEFTNKNSIQSAAIHASVAGMEGFDGPVFSLLDNDLDTMSKEDMNRITAEIEENTPGPQMDIQPECPACHFEQKMMIDWSWENFFSRSARRSTKRT